MGYGLLWIGRWLLCVVLRCGTSLYHGWVLHLYVFTVLLVCLRLAFNRSAVVADARSCHFDETWCHNRLKLLRKLFKVFGWRVKVIQWRDYVQNYRCHLFRAFWVRAKPLYDNLWIDPKEDGHRVAVELLLWMSMSTHVQAKSDDFLLAV